MVWSNLIRDRFLCVYQGNSSLSASPKHTTCWKKTYFGCPRASRFSSLWTSLHYYEWANWTKFLLVVIYGSPCRHSNSSKTFKKISTNWNKFVWPFCFKVNIQIYIQDHLNLYLLFQGSLYSVFFNQVYPTNAILFMNYT